MLPVSKKQLISEKKWVCNYEGCLLYFGIREQKQILIIAKKVYCFSKYSPLRSKDTFACVWTDCGSTFALWLRYHQKCILNAPTASPGGEKRWPLIFFTVPSQGYKAGESSNQCFECPKMQLFEPMYESSHCRVEEWSVFGGWLSWFLGRQLAHKCLNTSQNWLFCVVLVVRLQRV